MRVCVILLMLAAAGHVSADEAPPGALGCSGCHASESSLPLETLGATGIAEAMAAFKSGTREATLMNRIAVGFDEAEIKAIAAWIAKDR